MKLQGKSLTGYYSVREKLGEDPFAEIWEVKPIFSALELYGFFFKAVSKGADGRELLSYVRELYNLQHGNLVNVFECDRFEERVYILTEKVRGFRLSDYLANKEAFSVGEALSIVYELLDVLVYLHRRGLRRNLVVPQTIWISPHLPFLNRIRLACFGYQFAWTPTSSDPGVKALGPYLAPEIRKAQPASVDFASDLYSVGVILFRLLTGELPRKAGTEEGAMPVAQAEKRLREQGVPRDVRRLVSSLMKIRAAQRARSAEGLAEAVLAAIRRYASQEHGEVDARAYLNEASRRSDEVARPLTWDPLTVYGRRSSETTQQEAPFSSVRNQYFSRLAEEFVRSRAHAALEWSRAAFVAPDPQDAPGPQDFVDETRQVSEALFETSRPQSVLAEAEEVEWLAELEPADESSEGQADPPKTKDPWWRAWKRWWLALWRRMTQGRSKG